MPNHPYSSKSGYYPLHRYIYEKYIDRYLDKKEIIHHIDGNKLNNKITNLERLPSLKAHSLKHYASMAVDDKGRFSRCAEVS